MSVTTNLPDPYHYASKIMMLRKEQAEIGSEIRSYFAAAAEAGYPRAAMASAIRDALKLQKAQENNQLDLFRSNEERAEAFKQEFIAKMGLAA
jgi:uncharacterized protein (UPF0335 family)